MIKVGAILNAVFLITVLFNLFSWFILPDNTAIHFSRGGVPDNWASKDAHVIIFTGIMVVLYAGFVLSPNLLSGLPAKYINLPNREYWLRDENRPEAESRMRELMLTFGIATGLFMLSVSAMSVAANLSEPVRLSEGIFLVIFISYIAYTVMWLVRLLTAFRIPE
jgi:uncharacterized membrane protein